jgi:hypothetical protein
MMILKEAVTKEVTEKKTVVEKDAVHGCDYCKSEMKRYRAIGIDYEPQHKIRYEEFCSWLCLMKRVLSMNEQDTHKIDGLSVGYDPIFSDFVNEEHFITALRALKPDKREPC